MTAAEAIAQEHVAWLRREGGTVKQAFSALGHPMPAEAGWDDAVWLYASTWAQMQRKEAA